MDENESVTRWIEQLKQGDQQAAQELWERYHRRLAGLARRKLGGMPRRVVDEDDVVSSAFRTFCRRAAEGKFTQLADRDDLWNLLVVITARKSANQINHQNRAKRGGGNVRGETELPTGENAGEGLFDFVGREPTPEFVASFSEVLSGFMESLDDPTHRVIVLWKFENRTNIEIARELECSVSAVERKLRMIRKKLSYVEESA